MDLLIKNGRLVMDSEVIAGDLAIDGGRICAVGTDLSALESGADKVIDAEERLVTPGGVDVHAHMSYHVGGCDTSDDFASASAAALAGGTTCIMDFVETKESESMADALDRRRRQAEELCRCDFSLHMSVLPHDMDKLDQIAGIVADGCPSFKHYTAYAFTLDDGQLLRSFKAIAEAHGLPVVHAEDWALIQELIRRAHEEGHLEPKYHPLCRPAESEGEAVRRVIDIARLAGSDLFLFHQSAKEDLQEIERGRRLGQTIFAETCPHYTCLDSTIFEAMGPLPICSPPIREAGHQLPLAEGLKRGVLDSVSSDHCPFTRAEKHRAAAFNQVPGGLSSIETRMMLIKDLPGMSLTRWVQVTSSNPAAIAGLTGKGRLLPGFDADAVIWSREPYTIKSEKLQEKADWSPYEGRTVSAHPDLVIANGRIAAENGRVLAKIGSGRYLKRKLNR